MIEIQVAGAGAGKTFGMAKKIIERFDPKSHKDIVAITYTNAAAANIADELIKQFGFLPENIKVCTVHTFLLNEIIYPYSPAILGQIYNTSTRCSLSFGKQKARDKPLTEIERKAEEAKQRAIIISNLKKIQVIHVDEVFAVARQIVDPDHSKNKTKIKKAKVNRVLGFLNSSIDKIFLDETQDLNSIALKAFKAIGENAVDIYMVGDPKQAIKYPGKFQELLDENDNNNKITKLKPNNTSRRVPQKILDLSNQFCPLDQEQISLSDIEGQLSYIVSSDDGYDDFIVYHIGKKSLVSIYQKSGDYSTRSTDTMPDIHPDVNELLVKHNLDIDKDLVLGAASHWLAANITQHPQHQVISKFRKAFNIPHSLKTYAQLCDTVRRHDPSLTNTAKYHISSIDRTKGLESDVCVLVLTQAIYKYLVKDKLKPVDVYNRTWNMVYVALTRSRSELVIAIDKALFTDDPSADDIVTGIEALGFERLDLRKS